MRECPICGAPARVTEVSEERDPGELVYSNLRGPIGRTRGAEGFRIEFECRAGCQGSIRTRDRRAVEHAIKSVREVMRHVERPARFDAWTAPDPEPVSESITVPLPEWPEDGK